jgi:hypothetical protein
VTPPGDAERASRRFLLALFLAALAVRIAAMAVLDTPGAARGASPWRWGHEPAQLAQSLLEGRGFADPWGKGTGPSSWLTPPYPALLALVLGACGGLGPGAAAALFALQSLASAATCLALVRLGREAGSARAGRLAGWLLAVYPLSIAYAVELVWDTTFAAAALAGLFVVLLRLRRDPRGAAGAGLAYGGTLMLNPAPLSLAPALLAFVGARAGAKGLAAFAACALAVCAPWIARNQLVLGSPSLRPNFGVELRIGNHDQANGRPVAFRYHPSHVESELALYRELGEVGYARENLDRALRWIRARPGRFLELTARRFRLFWLGESPVRDPRREDGLSPAGDPSSWVKFVAYALAAAGGAAGLALGRLERGARALLAASLVLYGVPYYLSHVSERYRFPVDPLLLLGCAALLVTLWERRRAAREAAGR